MLFEPHAFQSHGVPKKMIYIQAGLTPHLCRNLQEGKVTAIITRWVHRTSSDFQYLRSATAHSLVKNPSLTWILTIQVTNYAGLGIM